MLLPFAGEQGAKANANDYRDKDSEEEKGNAVAALFIVSRGQGLVIGSPVVSRGGGVCFHSAGGHRKGLGNGLAGAINRLLNSADEPSGSLPVFSVGDGITHSLGLGLAALVFNDAGQAGKAVRVQLHNHPGQVTHPHSQGVDSAKGIVIFSGHRAGGHR